MWVTSSLEAVRTPTVVALGNFDGVHWGHRHVIEPILSKVHQYNLEYPEHFAAQLHNSDLGHSKPSADEFSNITGSTHEMTLPNSAVSTLLSFVPHPQEFFTGQIRPLLTPLDEKIEYLDSIGLEQFVLLPFNQALANMTPEIFVEEILVKSLKAQFVSVGQNFRFGCRRLGTVNDLKAIAARFGVDVYIAPLYVDDQERVSSSVIRQALADGDLQRANRLLGRPYKLIGTVVDGQHLGRTIGFPTANLDLPADKLLPRHGVYFVHVDDLTDAQGAIAHPAVMNLGHRPTVDGIQLTAEVHLLDWSKTIYGHRLAVHLNSFLRPEKKFASLDDLKAQIRADCDVARTLAQSKT